MMNSNLFKVESKQENYSLHFLNIYFHHNLIKEHTAVRKVVEHIMVAQITITLNKTPRSFKS